jgi:hypothetical protein
MAVLVLTGEPWIRADAESTLRPVRAEGRCCWWLYNARADELRRRAIRHFR